VPTTDIVKSYYEQTEKLRNEKIFSGEINIIDSLPSEIIEELLSQGIDLKKNQFYCPVETPAVNPKGDKLRQNVLLGTPLH